MKAKFNIINQMTEDALKLELPENLSYCSTVWKDTKERLTFYRDELKRLMLGRNKKETSINEELDKIDYDKYDMFSIVDEYAGWGCCISDIYSLLGTSLFIPDVFEDYDDPRC